MAVVVTALSLAGAADAASTATLTRSESSLLTAMNEVRLAERPAAAARRPEARARGPSPQLAHASHGHVRPRRLQRAHPPVTGVRARRVGENLAWGQGRLGAARTILRLWLASPEHRANLLHPGYRIVGVGALRGCFAGHRHTLMVTTDFAGR